jgi:hypothetical protein
VTLASSSGFGSRLLAGKRFSQFHAKLDIKNKNKKKETERVNFIINTTLYRSTEGKKIINFLKKVRACKLSPDS